MDLANLDVTINPAGAQAGAKAVQAAVLQMGATTESVVVGMGGSFDRLKSKMLSLRSTFVTLGFAGSLYGAVKVLGDFESNMAAVKAVTGSTNDQFKKLVQTARTMGGSSVFPATEISKSMIDMGQAGWKAERIIAAIGPTMKIAQVGLTSLGTATKVVDGVMNAFQLRMDGVAAVGDVMSAVFTDSQSTLAELGVAFRQTGATAHLAGQDIRDIAAMIGTMGSVSIRGSMAGVAIRNMIMSLEGPTSRATRALHSLGLTLKDVSPSGQSLLQVVHKLKDAHIGIAEATDIFGKRTANSIMSLIDQSHKMDEIAAKTHNAAGELDHMSDIMNDNLVGAYHRLIATVQESILQLGDGGLLGALRSTVDTVTGVIRVLNGMEDPLNKNNALYRQLATGVQILSALMAGLFVGSMVNKILQMGSALFTLTKMLYQAATGAAALDVALAANPIGLIVAAVAALTAALFIFGNKTFEVGGVTVSTWSLIKTVMGDVGSALSGVYDWFKSLGTGLGQLWDAFKQAWPAIKTIVMTALNSIWDLWKKGLNLEIATILTLVDAFQTMGSLVITIYKNMWTTISGFFTNIAKAGSDLLKGDFAAVGRDASAAFTSHLGDGVPEAIQALKDKTVKHFQTDFTNDAVKAATEASKTIGAAASLYGKYVVDRSVVKPKAKNETGAILAGMAGDPLTPHGGLPGAAEGAGENASSGTARIKALDSVSIKIKEQINLLNQKNVASMQEIEFGKIQAQLQLKKIQLTPVEAKGIMDLLDAQAKAMKDSDLRTYNQGLTDQINLNNKIGPQKQVQQQLDQLVNDEKKKGIFLTQQEILVEKQHLEAAQRSNAVNQAAEQLYNQLVAPAQAYADSIAAINKLLKDQAINQDQANMATMRAKEAELASKTDAVSGFQSGLLSMRDSVGTWADTVKSMTTSTFQTLSDGIAQWATTGKLNVGDMARSIISDLIRMAVQAMITRAAMSVFGMASGGATTGGGSGGNAIAMANGGVTAFANGGTNNANAFIKGGGVLKSAVYFPMKHGLGLAGEAGPEAFFPLKRGGVPQIGPDGRETILPLKRSGGKLVVGTSNDASSILGRTSGSFTAFADGGVSMPVVGSEAGGGTGRIPTGGGSSTTNNSPSVVFAPKVDVHVGQNAGQQDSKAGVDAAKQMRRELEGMFTDFVRNQQRPGGMLGQNRGSTG